MPARPYQQECIDLLTRLPPGRYLVQMATGLGKTYTFTHLPFHKRMLILSHREELVRQPLRWFTCPTGVEMAGQRAGPEARVVSASVQSIARRLERYTPEDFDLVIVDEAHHAASRTYRKILTYFQPEKTVGFTATPNRGDRVRLDDIFSEIVFRRDLRWGIVNGYLSDVTCKRVNIGYDLTAVRSRHGDYAPGELDEAMEGTADAIAEAYRTLARGATLIFSVSVRQCREIAAKIPGAVVVTGETEGRAQIVRDFTEGRIPCLVNCMVFTEGTDIPRVETVILARPTQSDSLYTQMVGRGLRPYPGKESLLLIDCVGTAKPGRLQTAPSLMGVDLSNIPERRQETLEGDLLELPVKAAAAADCPESWIRNVEIVNLWAREQQYQLHDVNWFRLPDGRMTVCLRDRRRLTIPCPDALGRVTLGGELVDYQTALDRAYRRLREDFPDERYIWDTSVSAKWGRQPASEAQLRVIRRQCRGFDTENLTKGQASQILNRLSQRWADGTQKPGKAWA